MKGQLSKFSEVFWTTRSVTGTQLSSILKAVTDNMEMDARDSVPRKLYLGTLKSEFHIISHVTKYYSFDFCQPIKTCQNCSWLSDHINRQWVRSGPRAAFAHPWLTLSVGFPSRSSLPVSESQNGNEGKEPVGERFSKVLPLWILQGDGQRRR